MKKANYSIRISPCMCVHEWQKWDVRGGGGGG